jgi:hypothetical protein
MRFRFLHAADIHLDSPLTGLTQYVFTGTEAGPLPELPQTLDKKDKNKMSRGPDRRRSEPPRVAFYKVNPMS